MTAPADSSAESEAMTNCATGSGSSSVIERSWLVVVPRVAFDGDERVNVAISVASWRLSLTTLTVAVVATEPGANVTVPESRLASSGIAVPLAVTVTVTGSALGAESTRSIDALPAPSEMLLDPLTKETVGTVSSSMIVTVWVAGVPTSAPVAESMVMIAVSSDSSSVSAITLRSTVAVSIPSGIMIEVWGRLASSPGVAVPARLSWTIVSSPETASSSRSAETGPADSPVL